MKVFFDTSIYISEYAFGGVAELVVARTLAARWRIQINQYTLDETAQVLRDSFFFGSGVVAKIRKQMAGRSRMIPTFHSRHRVKADRDDDQILQGALAAGADYLVTGDQHLLSLDPYESVRIVSLAAYRQLLLNRGLLTSSDS